MSGFQAVNTSLAPEDATRPHPHSHDATTPTTPRPESASTGSAKRRAPMDESSPTTPTRNSFGGLPGQRPLPGDNSFSSPIPGRPEAGNSPAQSGPSRNNSHRSTHSVGSEALDMDESDDGQDGSEDESVGGDPSKPSKKKKGQRFFCTEFPPCSLSFTRSEHLARHIRKHTGERPFQCHCARRFSRLDNLRQHAQTVHCNEEIPNDSLAATGTRFQRQIRTDRVRTPGARSRASTAGSQSSHGRGHSRNLSSSSIGSTNSSVSLRDDVRRRPPPLMMATDPAARRGLGLDNFRASPDSPGSREGQYRGYSTQSPGGFSTPTSATFSTGPGSPRFGSHMQSPGSGIPRSTVWDSRAPGRRLSVPSGPNPFQYAPTSHQNPPYFSPLASGSTSTMSGNSSFFGSPTSSNFSPGREFASRAAQDAEYKRRTWHPTTRSTFNSPLADSSTAYTSSSTHRPLFPQNMAQGSSQESGTTLPGIESFDQVHNRRATPPRRGPSPMQIDQAGPPGPSEQPPQQPPPGSGHRRGHSGWDMGLHQNLTRLDITSTPPQEPPLTWTEPQPEYGRQSGPPMHQGYAMQPQYHQQATAPQYVSQAMPPHQQQHQQYYQQQHQQHQQHHQQQHQQLPQQQPQQRPQQPQQQPQQPAPTPPPRQQQQQQQEAVNQGQGPQTPRNNRSKRQGWYQGPPSAHQSLNTHRRSPEDSSSSDGVHTPSTSSIGESNPSIVHSNGWVESSPGIPTEEATHQNYPTPNGPPEGFPLGSATAGANTATVTQAETPKRDDQNFRLETLVAVATRENQAADQPYR